MQDAFTAIANVLRRSERITKLARWMGIGDFVEPIRRWLYTEHIATVDVGSYRFSMVIDNPMSEEWYERDARDGAIARLWGSDFSRVGDHLEQRWKKADSYFNALEPDDKSAVCDAISAQYLDGRLNEEVRRRLISLGIVRDDEKLVVNYRGLEPFGEEILAFLLWRRPDLWSSSLKGH